MLPTQGVHSPSTTRWMKITGEERNCTQCFQHAAGYIYAPPEEEKDGNIVRPQYICTHYYRRAPFTPPLAMWDHHGKQVHRNSNHLTNTEVGGAWLHFQLSLPLF